MQNKWEFDIEWQNHNFLMIDAKINFLIVITFIIHYDS